MMGVVWNSGLLDKNIFIVFDDSFIHIYISGRFSINGVLIEKLNEKIPLLSNQIPLLMNSEEIVIATPNGHVTTTLLDFLGENFTNQQVNFDYEHHINKHIEFQKFSTASKLCSVLKSNKMWLKLAEESLKYLEIKIALQAYKNIGNIAMVSSLERISNIEDKKLLAGYCSMFLKDYTKAQRWFLSSEYPQAALQMEKDLLHWDHALDISKIVAPEQIPLISREYAQQLEFIGNYSEAYILYEKGLADGDNDMDPEHIFLCKCGTARTTIRCGNYKQGFIIANEVNKKELYLECADILMSMKQFLEAAVCYEKARMFDKAASAYIKVKNWKKVEELLTNVTSNKIHVQYATAKEAEGKYDEAIKSYYTANDINSVIRLQLDYLNDPTTAVELAKEIKSIEGFKMVASFFQRINDYSSAVKYLILSNSFEEAYELAKKHKILYLYGDILIDAVPLESIRAQDFNALASHFEQERNSFLAGKFYFYAKEYNRALDLLLKSSKSPAYESQAISLAIDIVASSNDTQLGVRLVDFLLGETDGIPKDPKHLFRLYMAQKKYKDAAKSAIIIANEEQINGNYKNARDILFNMYQELKMNEVAVSYDMYHNLMLLHSYILVRIHVKKGDHMTAARLLVRVAENISKFPSHTLPILTSTVIECHRANLKKFAYKYATMLVQNSNYRKEVDPKYVRKIESIVRKMPKNDLVSTDHSSELLDPATACPYCGTSFPEMEILCPGCKNNVPVCIVTGRHITPGDLTICHECQFPALKAKFLEILDLEEKSCPMCQATVDPIKLERVAVSQLQI